MQLHLTLFALAMLLLPGIAAAFDLSAKPIGSIAQWRTHNGITSVEVLARNGKLFMRAFERYHPLKKAPKHDR